MSKFKLFLNLICCTLFSVNVFSDEIKIYTWEDYFSPDVIHQFETESGHTVKQVYFEKEMLRDAVIHSGKADIYDIVVLDGHTLKQFIKDGLLSKVEDPLFNRADIFLPEATQACGEYGVPYASGSIGIGYRASKVSEKFDSWMDLFDYTNKNPERVVIPSEDVDTLAITLMALGYHPLSENKAELREAYHLLDDTLGSLLAFRNSSGYAIEKKHNAQMDVGVFYSGETELITKATGFDDWRYVIPKDGTLIWYECLVSHHNRPMNTATMDFLKFLNRPGIAAKNAQDMWFATLNKGALKLVESEYLNDDELFPKILSKRNAFHYKQISDDSLKLRSNIINILSEK